MASEALDPDVLSEPLEELHEAVEEARRLRESLLHGDEGSAHGKDGLKSWDSEPRGDGTRA